MTVEIMPRYNLDTCSMIVEFNASVWTARKLDKGVSEEVTTGKLAYKDAARVNKNLMAGRKELAEITSHVDATRVWLHQRTFPWSDNGQRGLPTIGFMDFEAGAKEREDRFWYLVNEFIALYPTLVTAQAMAMGKMFNRADFPTVAGLSNRFAFSINYLPMPTAGNFIIDVGNAAQAELQDRLVKLGNARVEAAMRDVRTRLKDHLIRMSDRLGLDILAGEVKTRRFHDSLVDGGLELCELVKGLNLTQDAELESARRALEQTLLGVTPKELRRNMPIRNEVKQRVDEILSKFQ